MTPVCTNRHSANDNGATKWSRNFIFNTVLMIKPVEGEPVAPSQYFKGTFQDHLWDIVGGAIWGVFIWKEFKEAPASTNKLIWLMFIGYALGLASLIVARLV